MGITLAKARYADAKGQSEFAGALITAAVSAIEDCSNLHGASSPVWNEVLETLGSPDVALGAIETLQMQQPLLVSGEARPFIEKFAQAFIVAAVDPNTAGGRNTVAVLAAIGLLRAQLESVKPPADLLQTIDWYRRPHAPKFRVAPEMHESRLLLGVEIIEGDVPGDIRASWAINDGPEVTPLLMYKPGTRWARKANPADCEFRMRESGNEAHLRIRFVFADGEHGYHYVFPLEKHEKGHWMLQTHLGTGVHTPEPF
jgi:hypothetical protein